MEAKRQQTPGNAQVIPDQETPSPAPSVTPRIMASPHRSAVDGANLQPSQGSGVAAAAPGRSNWGAKISPEARSRNTYDITKALKKCLPTSGPEDLIWNTLREVAVQYEENMYNSSTSQISRKMIYMEAKRNQAPGNVQVIPNKDTAGSASCVSQTFPLQNMPGMPMAMNNGLGQRTPKDIYAAQREVSLVQQQQQQQQSQSQYQLIYQQLQMLMQQNALKICLGQRPPHDIYLAQREMSLVQQRQQQLQSQNHFIYQQQQMLLKQRLEQRFQEKRTPTRPHIQQLPSLMQSKQMQAYSPEKPS